MKIFIVAVLISSFCDIIFSAEPVEKDYKQFQRVAAVSLLKRTRDSKIADVVELKKFESDTDYNLTKLGCTFSDFQIYNALVLGHFPGRKTCFTVTIPSEWEECSTNYLGAATLDTQKSLAITAPSDQGDGACIVLWNYESKGDITTLRSDSEEPIKSLLLADNGENSKRF